MPIGHYKNGRGPGKDVGHCYQSAVDEEKTDDELG